MSLLSRARAAYRAFSRPNVGTRGYDAARGGRLYSDWIAGAMSSDAEIRASLRKLIDRSRDLERNNDYQRGFLLACERNILGAVRNDLRMDAGEMVGSAKGPVWQPDRLANTLIETAWTEWGKKGTCTVCGRYSWRDLKRLAVRAVPRDGSFIARKVRGASAGNRFGFAVQVWEVDHLDLQRFEERSDGSEVRFGIETNAMRRVTGYWLMARHPGDMNGGGFGPYRSSFFPADDMYHLYVSERPEQSIGIPWVVSAITRLRQLGAFEEAAVIAARIGASKLGFITRSGDKVGEYAGPTDANGVPEVNGDPGSFTTLPEGWSPQSWDPQYPNIETGDFRKAMLRGVGTSVGMSYNTLGNDLEAVNFSSARVGLFEEREGWKSLQTFYAEGLWEPIFKDWLMASILGGAIRLPFGKFAKFNRPVFKARRWPFIDPLKEVNAAKEEIALRISSRRAKIEEQGGDVDDVFQDNLDDEKLADAIGLSLAPAAPKPAADPGLEDDEDEDEDDLPANVPPKG